MKKLLFMLLMALVIAMLTVFPTTSYAVWNLLAIVNAVAQVDNL